MSVTTEKPSDQRFLRETGLAGTIAGVIEPVLEGLGYRLVRVTVSGRNGTTVQIMAERSDGTMTIEDCTEVSRNVSPVLDVHDLIAESYNLEVSSPGIDRPLVRPSDFVAWAGHEARIEVKEIIEGRKRFRGRIDGFESGEARLETEIEGIGRTVLGFPLSLISEAKLIMTDELVEESLRRAKRELAELTAGAEVPEVQLEDC